MLNSVFKMITPCTGANGSLTFIYQDNNHVSQWKHSKVCRPTTWNEISLCQHHDFDARKPTLMICFNIKQIISRILILVHHGWNPSVSIPRNKGGPKINKKIVDPSIVTPRCTSSMVLISMIWNESRFRIDPIYRSLGIVVKEIYPKLSMFYE